MSTSSNRTANTLAHSEALQQVKLLERPNRYVAYGLQATGERVKIYVPVGGRIGGLTLDDLPALVSGPYTGRATSYTLEAIGSHYDTESPHFQWLNINQNASNQRVASWLKSGSLAELTATTSLDTLKPERKLGAKRIDFTLDEGLPTELWLEVKTPLISLTAELDESLPLKTDYSAKPPSSRMGEQFEALAKKRAEGSRVALLGVFGYSLNKPISLEDSYLANLNLDGLVTTGLALGFEFWALQFTLNEQELQLQTLTRVFG